MMKSAAVLLALAAPLTSAFGPPLLQGARPARIAPQAEFDPLELCAPVDAGATTTATRVAAATTTAFAALAASPLAAWAAEEPDGYEYGAVAAPGGMALPVVGGILAILTAGVPVLLQGGEEALEQQRLDEKTKGAEFGKRK